MPQPKDLVETSALSACENDFLEFLIEARLVAKDSLDQLTNFLRTGKRSLVTLLPRLGLLTERDVAQALCEFLKLPALEKNAVVSLGNEIADISEPFFRQHHLIPIKLDDNVLDIAVVDPFDRYAIDALQFFLGVDVNIHISTSEEIEKHLNGWLSQQETDVSNDSGIGYDPSDPEAVNKLKDLASEAPVIKLVTRTVNRAIELGASDIHFEPTENQLKIRYRIDGMLRDIEDVQNRWSAAVVSRLKIMAHLDISNRRLPQDGRIKLSIRGTEVDFRVATTPSTNGESVVLRILDRSRLVFELEELGFSATLREKFEKLLTAPHGIILVTGPTGSGKTTTLYASLMRLNTSDRKLLTVEDPVEYTLEGVNQVQVMPDIGLTFANAMRTFLRHDPDVMMVGEIRDSETADIAVQAALTGHLVLSTLHTNDAPSAITRLQDIGVDGYLIASTVRGVVAQRLVRRLCENCKTPISADTLPNVPQIDAKVSFQGACKPVGCSQCGGSGYRGRTTILEVMPVSDHLGRMIGENRPAEELKKQALLEGFSTLFDDGMAKVAAGITSLEEVYRVTGGGDQS